MKGEEKVVEFPFFNIIWRENEENDVIEVVVFFARLESSVPPLISERKGKVERDVQTVLKPTKPNTRLKKNVVSTTFQKEIVPPYRSVLKEVFPRDVHDPLVQLLKSEFDGWKIVSSLTLKPPSPTTYIYGTFTDFPTVNKDRHTPSIQFHSFIDTTSPQMKDQSEIKIVFTVRWVFSFIMYIPPSVKERFTDLCHRQMETFKRVIERGVNLSTTAIQNSFPLLRELVERYLVPKLPEGIEFVEVTFSKRFDNSYVSVYSHYGFLTPSPYFPKAWDVAKILHFHTFLPYQVLPVWERILKGNDVKEVLGKVISLIRLTSISPPPDERLKELIDLWEFL